MAYSEFQKNISKKFEALFDEISAVYNFDNGPEFEIAFCKVLRILLPNKYGICRGFIVSKEGIEKGDDIIIYDQERFPTLRLLEDNTFAQKQKIPVEAVYAYIEAKHTLCIEGSGGQSLQKALSQVLDVKNLKRESVPLTRITPQVQINSYNANRPEFWPNYHNPLYCAIISRHVRIKESDKICEVDSFFENLKMHCNLISKIENAPDLIIAGSNAIVLPCVKTQFESPFFVNEHSHLDVIKSNGLAFANGLTSMLYAFDHILLGNIHWPSILAEGLGLELYMDEKNNCP